ncbi:MAG: sigma-54-dependent transcriptional regulator [Vicinamibacteria bacterium]
MSERVILVVDDEEAQRKVLSGFLRKRGYAVLQAGSADEALRLAGERTLDLALSDLRMPGKDGVALLDALRAQNPELPVVLMTAFASVKSAVDAMKRGAVDYLTKPVDLDELELLVTRTLERHALESENRALREELRARHRLEGLETANDRMAAAINTAARAAQSRASILLRGESGTGKELLARAIHQASPRARGPLVAVNVAALPETLLESELFGHERGAFTGADRERRGRFELADGGTLFLDEIGDLPKGTQVKLLRALQEQAFERLGGNRTLKVDVRVVAATHRDLEAMVKDGSFRDDLYYRLNVVSIELPPLRERREDIPMLVDRFLRRHAAEGAGRKSVSREAMDRLLKYDYPGNVRELENVVHRAVVLSREPLIAAADLPLPVQEQAEAAREDAATGSLVARVLAFERRLLRDALERAGGVQTRAARELGISERHLRYRLRKHGLEGAASSTRELPPPDEA